MIDEIIEYLRGTCKSESEAADAFGISEDEVLDAVVNTDEIERCDGCSWWYEKEELVEVDAENLCNDCL